jgi:hypothetical protein
MTDRERDQVGFDALTRLARDAADAPIAAELHSSGRRHVIEAMQAALPLRQRSRRGPVALGLFATAAAAAAAFALLSPSRTELLSYEIEGGERLSPNYLDAPADAHAKVQFSDGSVIDAQPGARVRIDAVRSNGARVFIERGTATARVQHRRGSNWQLVAGPFDVHVTGTRFTIAWDPVAQAIDLSLHEGSVEVDSPVGASHCVVRAGQRFRASVHEGTMKLEGDGAPSAGGPATTAIPAITTTAASASAERVTPPPQAVAPQPSPKIPSQAAARASLDPSAKRAEGRAEPWPELVRRGAFLAVVQAAEARGLEASLASGSVAEVRALADAARYTDHTELAERALLVLRERFAGTRHSAAAAFLLGRTDESQGQLEAADRWYRVYLDEAPDGELAADALAGRMRTTSSRQGAAAAKPLAQEYLRRYPDGVHLEAARRLLGHR